MKYRLHTSFYFSDTHTIEIAEYLDIEGPFVRLGKFDV